ncbi:pyrroline-5-carboxylate reductase 2-like [Crassostrea virginica]|uniref:Pyrroline-5-carboxylate reductase n=1 Tax=Crassostrea virginica TaxID=6565 RepID=A0A8B8DRJ6_CRAVI|nr:pyrroline-5-carboxylate reductase 2-like [Crassostrea virginica]
MARTEDQRFTVSESMTIGFIGAGRMAQAMSRGFISKGVVKPHKIMASDTVPQMLDTIREQGVRITNNNLEIVENSDLIIIAVKPHVVSPILQEVSGKVTREKLFLSIAAGVTLETLEKNLPSQTRVIRAMPNTPALVQTGATVIAPGSSILAGDKELIQGLFRTIGICEVGSEEQLDAVTGLSGSGPAYGFLAIESLADGGVKMGLPRDLAQKLAAQTLLGAAKMVLESGKHPGQLKDEVCSPGGTTIAAIHKLEETGFRSSLITAVETATVRAKELGVIESQKQQTVLLREQPAEQSTSRGQQFRAVQ